MPGQLAWVKVICLATQIPASALTPRGPKTAMTAALIMIWGEGLDIVEPVNGIFKALSQQDKQFSAEP